MVEMVLRPASNCGDCNQQVEVLQLIRGQQQDLSQALHISLDDGKHWQLRLFLNRIQHDGLRALVSSHLQLK